ncbi:hypothetical protein, partial [Prevotella sp.]
MRNKRGSVLCLGLVAAMMPFASSLQASSLTDHVCDVAVGHAQTQGLALQQSAKRHVTGSVVDANGEPIIGATINWSAAADSATQSLVNR